MKKRGFTLIELIIVVAILAVVSAVAIPTFQDFRQRARIAACWGALGAVRSGIAMYRSREISEGRSDGVTGSRGHPNGAQVNESPLNSNSGSRVVSDGDLPNNPFAPYDGIPPTKEDEVETGSSIFPPNITRTTGWRYNTITGQFWANSSYAGENTF